MREPARARVDPVAIDTVQAIPEHHPFGVDEGHGRVADLEVLLTGQDANGAVGRDGQSIERARLYPDGRRPGVGGDGLGIDDGHSVLRRQPELAVSRTDARPARSRRCTLRSAFPSLLPYDEELTADSVPAAKAFSCSLETRWMPRFDVIQKAAGVVFEDLEHAVVEQPVLHIDRREPAVLKSSEAAVVGANPQDAVAIEMKRSDAVAGEPVAFGPAREAAVLEE